MKTFALVLTLWFLLPTQARAIPAFARQTGASCSACHFQHFPGLTPFGRQFKAQGFTLSGGGPLIEGKLLSLARTLNASIVTKIRYVKTNGATGVGTDLGEFQFPDEASLWLGGRVSENVGFVLEAQLADPDAPILASFKLPIGFERGGNRFSAIPFSTDALGAPFGFELLNTGAVRNVRMLEDVGALSAQQYVLGDAGEGKAEGVALVFSNPHGFVNITPWTPSHGSATALDRPAWYLRAALTPRVDVWDVAFGMQQWFGNAQGSNQHARAWAADIQVQGQPGKFPLGLYATYARAPESPASKNLFFNPEPHGQPDGYAPPISIGGNMLVAPPANLFNAEPYAQEAVSLLAEVGIVPGRVTLAAALRMGDNGKATRNWDDAGLLGATFQFAQNVQFQLNHVQSWGDASTGTTGNQRTILMIFAAF